MRRDQLASIGERIALIRGRSSQADFSASVGIAKNTLGNYERGEREIGAVALIGLMALGWSADWLLSGEGPQRRSGAGLGVVENVDNGQSPSQPLSDEALTIALELADKALGGGYLPRPRYAKLVRLLYEGITQGLPFAQVLQFGQKASAAMANGDEVNDGEQGLGQPGRKAAG